MLLQTNSYVVPKERRSEHARLMRRFRQALQRLGCEDFEVFEQVGTNWTGGDTDRFVQIMRFRDRQHQISVQNAERSDPAAQQLIHDFCELINFTYQQQQGLFVVGFYNSLFPTGPLRSSAVAEDAPPAAPPTRTAPRPAPPKAQEPAEASDWPEAQDDADRQTTEEEVDDVSQAHHPHAESNGDEVNFDV